MCRWRANIRLLNHDQGMESRQNWLRMEEYRKGESRSEGRKGRGKLSKTIIVPSWISPDTTIWIKVIGLNGMLFATLESSLLYNICSKCAYLLKVSPSEFRSLYQWKYILFSNFRILGLSFELINLSETPKIMPLCNIYHYDVHFEPNLWKSFAVDDRSPSAIRR